MLLTILLFPFNIAMTAFFRLLNNVIRHRATNSHPVPVALFLISRLAAEIAARIHAHVSRCLPSHETVIKHGMGGMLSSGAVAPLRIINKSQSTVHKSQSTVHKPQFYKPHTLIPQLRQAIQEAPYHRNTVSCSAARKRRASSHNHITSPQWHHWHHWHHCHHLHRYFKLRLQVETTASFSSWQFQFRGARVEMRVPCEGGGCFFTRFKLKKFLCA